MSVISFDAPKSVALIDTLPKSHGDSERFKSVLTNGLPQQFGHIQHMHIAFAFTRVDAVFEHRHTERATDCDDFRAGFQRLSRALLVDAFVLRLFNEAHTAAAAATESLLAALLHLHG